MIEIKNVNQSYEKDKKFINNINLSIEDGNVFGFIGANGAGKTTTIEMMTGILNIDSGDILILEKNSALYRHIMSAYPKFKINIKHHNY